MSETKIIYLKLKSPRLDLFINGIITAYEYGWKRIGDKSKVHTGTPMIILLQKEVLVEENYPEETVWDCHFKNFPSVYPTTFSNAPVIAPIPQGEYPTGGIESIVPTEEGSYELIATDGTTTVTQTLEVVDGSDITDSQGLPEEFLDDLKIAVKEVEDGQVTPYVKLSKTEDGFEKRPYTLEDLKEIKWSDLMKLSASLGVADGKRPERELNIVKASLEQWGSV